MSDRYDDDTYDDDDEREQSSSPRGLREAVKKANKEKADAERKLADALKQIEELSAKVKTSTLRDALTDAGIDAKYAKFADRDGVEPTVEAVKKWADEMQDVYAFLAKKAPETPKVEAGTEGSEEGGEDLEDELDEELVQALKAAQQVEQGGRPSGSTDTISTLSKVDLSKVSDQSELVELLAKLGAPLV